MAVTHEDVRAIASLARLTVPSERLDALVAELNGILSHMEELSRIEGKDAARTAAESAQGMALAPDRGPPVGLERPPSTFAPAWRDGFFLVPRLATHGNAGANDTPDEEHSA